MAMTAVRMGAEQRREQLVRAALTEFARSGFAGTSTEAIAKRAGISQPYVFRLFGTKKDLFIAVINACYDKVYDAFETAAQGHAGTDAFAAMGVAYARLLQDREQLLAQMHAYAACDDADICAVTRAGYRRLFELVQRASGLPDEEIVRFFSVGMMINVIAAMDLPRLDQPWARALVGFTSPNLAH